MDLIEVEAADNLTIPGQMTSQDTLTMGMDPVRIIIINKMGGLLLEIRDKEMGTQEEDSMVEDVVEDNLTKAPMCDDLGQLVRQLTKIK